MHDRKGFLRDRSCSLPSRMSPTATNARTHTPDRHYSPRTQNRTYLSARPGMHVVVVVVTGRDDTIASLLLSLSYATVMQRGGAGRGGGRPLGRSGEGEGGVVAVG